LEILGIGLLLLLLLLSLKKVKIKSWSGYASESSCWDSWAIIIIIIIPAIHPALHIPSSKVVE